MTWAAIYHATVAVTMDCIYRIISYVDYDKKALMANVYTCDNATVSSQCDQSDEIVGVSRGHMAGKSRRDVKMMHFKGYQSKLSKVPRKIGKYFPNLEVLRIPVSSLPEVHKEDFKGLKKLRILYLGGNKLTTLDSDLFQYVPNLEYLAFNYNPVSHVGYGILDQLPNLRILHGGPTNCKGLGSVTDGNKKAIENFKNLLRTACPPTPEMMQITERKKAVITDWDIEDDDDDYDNDFDPEEFFGGWSTKDRKHQFNNQQCDQKYGI